MKRLLGSVALCLGLALAGGAIPLLGQTESITTTPISPTPVTPPQPPTVILKPFEGLLEKVQDRTLLEQDMAYNTLLSYIARLSPTEITQRTNLQISYKDLFLTPGRYRGEIIRAEGRLTYLRPYALDTNPAGIKIIYSGMIDSTTTDEYFKFHLIEKPLQRLISHESEQGIADEVRVEGAFLKIEQYRLADPRYGQESYVPFLIGRTITKLKIVPPTGVTQFKIVLGVIIGLAFIILVLLVFVSRRREKNLWKRLPKTR